MKTAIFFAVLCMVFLCTTHALTVTPAFICGSDGTSSCHAGETGYLALTFDEIPSPNINIYMAVPSNSTLGDCYEMIGNTASNNMGNPAPVDRDAFAGVYGNNAAYSNMFFAVTFTNLQSTTNVSIRCMYILTPVQGSVSLAPYTLSTDSSYPIAVYSASEAASTAQKSTVKFIAPVAPVLAVSTAVWKGNQGAAGKLILPIYAPFSIYQFDTIDIAIGSILGSGQLTTCALEGAAMQQDATTTTRFITSSGTGAGEMGYVSLSCDVTIPTSLTAAATVTVKVQRTYWYDPDGQNKVYTYPRFSQTVTVNPPSQAVVGGNDVNANVSLYPNTYIQGSSYRVLFETTDFNAELPIKIVTDNTDAAATTTYRSSLVMSLDLGEDFLEQDTTVTPQCSYSTSARDFNLYTPSRFTTTFAISGGKATWTSSTLVPLTDVTGKTVRIACNGLKLKDDLSITQFPYTPTTSSQTPLVASLTVRDINGSKIVAQNPSVPFAPLQLNQGGTEIEYAQHALKLKMSSRLTQQQVARLIEVYRSVLALPSTVTVTVSTQLISTVAANVSLAQITGIRTYASNDLTIYVMIRGTAAMTSDDIRRALNASTATTIANTLTDEWGLGQLAAQSAASSSTTPAHCNNNILDPEEFGIDCGGACLGCAASSKCESNSDCQSGSCASTCAALIDNSVFTVSSIAAIIVAVVATFVF